MTLTVVKTTALTGTITNAQLAGGIDLTSKVTGTLPIANGGTNSTATTFVNAASNVTGALPIVNGGTGATTFSPGKIIQTKMEGNYNFSSDTSSNSETYAGFGNEITITPTSSSNALMFHMMISDVFFSSNEGIRIDIYDKTNSTWVAGSTSRKASFHAGSTVNGLNTPVTLMEILETAGSGARTYQGYYRTETSGEAVYINNGGSNGFVRFCIMEVVKDD